MKEELEVLSALVDGEAVDPAELEHALDSPEAHSVLVDFARLRRELASNDVPDPDLATRLERAVSGRRRTGWLAAAAALLLLAVGVPAWLDREPPDAVAPIPEIDRVLRFEPGVDWNAG